MAVVTWDLKIILCFSVANRCIVFSIAGFCSVMDGGFRETRHLKDLLLVNLDLIQRQQELLSEKDKRIQHLQHENETVRPVYSLIMSWGRFLFKRVCIMFISDLLVFACQHYVKRMMTFQSELSYWLKKEWDPVHYSGCWHKETHLVTKKCSTSHPSGWREQPLNSPDKYVCMGGCVCVSLSFTGLYCGQLLPLMLNKNKPSRLRPRLRPPCQVWDKNFGLKTETDTKRSRLRD